MNALLTETLQVKSFDLDPDATSATDVSWQPTKGFDRFLFQFFRTVGTSDVTIKVLGNSASNGGGTDVEIKSLTNAQFGDPDAVGDYAFVEVSMDEIIAAAESGCDYISLNVAFGTGTDEAVITYIFGGARYGQAALTANNIA